MKQYVIERYEFSELSDEAKEVAIEQECRLSYEILDTDLITNELEYELGKLLGKAIDGLTINYSLSYSQGDGVSFTGTLTPENAPLLNWPTVGGVERVELFRNSSHYYHEYTIRPAYLNADGDELDDAPYEAFMDEIRAICRKLARVGYKMIEDMASREGAIESLNEAGAVFLESGKISHPVGLVA